MNTAAYEKGIKGKSERKKSLIHAIFFLKNFGRIEEKDNTQKERFFHNKNLKSPKLKIQYNQLLLSLH
tara:strand:- start:3 stop:206 length:204 start_codon:yes stop_codon:yes gene_type:complete